ncbi:phospholipid-translocating P-type ATPase [Acephala macrosclerotiorum]|nr:phospholipid-translocating P-type ATPase [Acephala macrosclerotiorum]
MIEEPEIHDYQDDQTKKTVLKVEIANGDFSQNEKAAIEANSYVETGATTATKTFTFAEYRSWSQWRQREAIQKANSWYKDYILHGVLRRRPLAPSKDGRYIELDASRSTPLIDERSGHPHIDNHIRSSRYTLLSFFPAQLWFQFTKLANFYFLVTGIIQLIPGLSTTGTYTTILPLLFFLSFSILREGYDDFRRYRLDKTENRRPTRVLHRFKYRTHDEEVIVEATTATPYAKEFPATSTTVNSEDLDSSHWSTVKWIDLRVGDIIELRRDEQVPADIVLLSAEGRNGIAYIETMALDGETNLKGKQPPSILAKRCSTLDDISICHAHFVIEDPNLDLYEFNGKVTVDGKTVPLTLANVVYRGSTLRNTIRAIGMVINTGEECKIRMNANKNPQAKAPAIQKMTNHVVFYLAALVILLSIGCSAGYLIWTKVYERKAWYLADSHIRFADIFIAFAIMYNNLIPLALYVSLEIVKFCQYWLIQDVEMYDEVSNTPFVSNTQTIYENLGQISYIFSDKTGTLTENVMRFRKMSVAGAVWAHNKDCEETGDEPVSQHNESEASSPLDGKCAVDAKTKKTISSEYPSRVESQYPSASLVPSSPESTSGPANGEKDTAELQQHLVADPNSSSSESIKMFLLSLALCHTCFPEVQVDGKVTYQATSPDEEALVVAAQELGCNLTARDSQFITLQVPSPENGGVSEERYEILDVIEFSTHRKRMSIIVRFPDGRICLFCKGADSIMQPRFRHYSAHTEKITRDRDLLAIEGGMGGSEIFSRCHEHIDSFASEGLRTLVYGHRYIEESEYKDWSLRYHAATTSLANRQTMIEEAGELIEHGFTLGGATAIEDRLQKGVPETIEKLQKANIKIWMLTGDKRETAINIAHSAHICKPDSKFIILDDENSSPIDAQITSALSELAASKISHSVIVIDGQTLISVEANAPLASTFYTLLLSAHSVIVCRASPSQKASMVRSIRHLQPDKLTLAIGDGGNDITMITEAHVGIGISGKEGLQAARVADFSIAQFRFLQRLLLVHGHWNYIRTSKFILYTFWKEMLFYSIQCLSQRWNGYTGTSLFESMSLTFWNTLFTSLCVIVPGIWEKDLSAEILLERPELYRVGQDAREFNLRSYVWWMGMAAVEAVLAYFMVYGLYGNDMMRQDQGLWAFGDLLFSICVVFINIKLLFLSYHHLTWIPIAALLVTITGWWAFNLFLSVIYGRSPGPYYVRDAFIYHFGKDLDWWATHVIVVAALLAIEIAVKVMRRSCWPTEVDLWQEKEAERARAKKDS